MTPARAAWVSLLLLCAAALATEGGLRAQEAPAAFSDRVESVAFSPDGRFLVSGRWDGALRLWRVASGEAILSFAARKDAVSSVAFAPNGRAIASASWDGTIKLWSAANGAPIETLAAPAASPKDDRLSPPR
jgi:WD40 repeat protein